MLITPPTPVFLPDDLSLFLAGGITGCADWQSEMIEKLDRPGLTLFSPRREVDETWQWTDEGSRAQILWEQIAIGMSDAVSFWFSFETIQPIALYELGRMTDAGEAMFVGAHPDYQRRFDVVTQLGFLRPEITVVDNLDDLCAQIVDWVDG